MKLQTQRSASRVTRLFGTLATAASAFAVATWGEVSVAQVAPSATAVQAADYATGEVRKIDMEQSKLTIKHGPIDSLGMPGMTMVFRLKDATMARGLNAGDTVRFKAVADSGSIVITDLQRLP